MRVSLDLVGMGWVGLGERGVVVVLGESLLVVMVVLNDLHGALLLLDQLLEPVCLVAQFECFLFLFV